MGESKGEIFIKTIKYVLLFFSLSMAFSVTSVLANDTPSKFDNYIPAFGGSLYTETKYKDTLTTQEVRYTDVYTYGDHIKAQLRNGVGGAYMAPSYNITTGNDIIYDNDYAEWVGSQYAIQLSSEIWYVSSTRLSFSWYIH